MVVITPDTRRIIYVVPKAVEHCRCAKEEVHLLRIGGGWLMVATAEMIAVKSDLGT